VNRQTLETTVLVNIVATVPSTPDPDQSRAHTRIMCAHAMYIKLPYFSSFLFLRRL